MNMHVGVWDFSTSVLASRARWCKPTLLGCDTGGLHGLGWCGFIYLAPEGIARYCFHSVWKHDKCVCPANILVFYLSAIGRDIDLKCIRDTYSNTVVLNSLTSTVLLNSVTKLTFICQRLRSQERYIIFWRLGSRTLNTSLGMRWNHNLRPGCRRRLLWHFTPR